MKVVRIAVVLGLLAIPFGILGRAFYLDAYYYAYGPRVEDTARGAVIPVTVHHGAKVFLTERQWRRFGSATADAIQIIAFCGGAASAFVLNQRWKVLKNRRDAA